MRRIAVRCCVVGGGPAGMMLGYLLGRAGIDTLVLEKHADFFRDFRGDTVHPSTLTVLDELGLVHDFLKLPHQELRRMEGEIGTQRFRIADLSRLSAPHPFIALMPQWDFLNFLREKGSGFPSLTLMMRTAATDLLLAGDTVRGVRAETPEGPIEISADLTVACDGRHSVLRDRSGLEVEDIGAPIDVLWFRAGKGAATDSLFARIDGGEMMVTFDRGDYWQCAYVIAKGAFEAVKARGLDAFRAAVIRMVPLLAGGIAEVATWDDVKLLTVTINRLRRWSRPGLLCIGDAAHAMSPVGGVGVNLAVQDAVATANLLAARLADGCPPGAVLDEVRRRREFPTRTTQRMQVVIQNTILTPALEASAGPFEPPLALRLVSATPWLQGLTARLLGIGVRAEHVRSPVAASAS
ncbi:FAD-dependent oxidoreductase [Amaricoccus solimangrovi]|uniref:FAD-dependent oxidoreductase n=1 Tax=Amaricoccus solimangrovi TaxID=2589815 RepID=A0A501WVH4_9RHOB|nr:FAD-dependent oxidoreductase [Amaricoccus solimangrovi]TPE53279.1 FAD-dependent oxidoreductase [Amaricoccus solimangrovi]